MIVRRGAVVGAAVATAVAVAAGTASAAGRTSPSVSFFQGGAGQANWSRFMSNDDDPFSMRLSVPSNASYAGIRLHHVTSELPADEPSFMFHEDGAPSGGAPRLVILAPDGCYADEYAVQPYGDWNTATQWDLMGTCGYGYNVGWGGVQSAFEHRTVASVYLVSDAYAGAHTDYVDNIVYAGKTISQPSDNANSR